MDNNNIDNNIDIDYEINTKGEENNSLLLKKTYRTCLNDLTKKMKNSSKKRIFFHSKNFIFSLYGFKKFFYNL